MKSIAVLMTCHNRIKKTLDCLDSLFRCKLPDKTILDVFLVDDGSTDGTGAGVKKRFPQVIVIQGTGNLFWNRGMHLAWETAAKHKEYDYFLWLNDDVEIFRESVCELINLTDHVNCISIGSMRSQNTNKTTYGGWSVQGVIIDPNGIPQKCNEFNGNLVLIPKNIFAELGNLDPVYPHAIGDFDYALRARKRDLACYVAPEYCGYCEKHEKLPKWCLPEIPFFERLRFLYSPLALSHPCYFFRFENRHYSLGIAVRHFLSIHLRVAFPSLWK